MIDDVCAGRACEHQPGEWAEKSLVKRSAEIPALIPVDQENAQPRKKPENEKQRAEAKSFERFLFFRKQVREKANTASHAKERHGDVIENRKTREEKKPRENAPRSIRIKPEQGEEQNPDHGKERVEDVDFKNRNIPPDRMPDHEKNRGDKSRDPRLEIQEHDPIEQSNRDRPDESGRQIRLVCDLFHRQSPDDESHPLIAQVMTIDIGRDDALHGVVDDHCHLPRADAGRAGPEINKKGKKYEGMLLE